MDAIGASRAGDSARTDAGRFSRQVFLGVSLLLLVASAAVTVGWCASMSMMGELPMPGGWSLSMAWTRMCGQMWSDVAVAFVGMWMVMMMAMMLPSLLPALWRYHQTIERAGAGRPGQLAVLAGAGYFLVWTVLGMVVFVLGAALAAAEMRLPMFARVIPAAGGMTVLGAGALQCTAWKARHLACCREVPAPDGPLPSGSRTAWRLGLRAGLHCSASCAGLTAILLVFGIMDLRAMVVVTAAIGAERLAPAGLRVERVIGAIAMVAGLFLVARAVGLE